MIDRGEWAIMGGFVAFVVGIITIAYFTEASRHRECIEGCVSEHIEATRGRCEWRCSFGLPKRGDDTVVMPIYMPVQQ